MRVLLLQPDLAPEKRYGSFADLGSYTAPQGLLYLAGIVSQAGHSVRVVDLEIAGRAASEELERALDAPLDLVGITATTPAVHSAAKIAERVKARYPHMPVVLGGHHASALPERTLERFPAIDAAVVGEAEISFRELCARIERDGAEALLGAPGTVSRGPQGFVTGPPVDAIEDLDTLPMPLFSALEGFPSRYKPGVNVARRQPSASLVTSRGCPFACSFCGKSVFGRKVRAHSVDWILRAFELLQREHGVRDVFFHDDVFLHDPKRVERMAKGMIERRMDLTWSCIARPEPLSSELYSTYHESGCWQISFGIESISAKVLDYMEKRTRLERIREAVLVAADTGILVNGLFILGSPGDTTESMKETLRFARSMPFSSVQFSLFTPLPGSSSYSAFEETLDLEERWEDLTTWNPVKLPDGPSEAALRRLQARFYLNAYLRPRRILETLRGSGTFDLDAALRGFRVLLKLMVRAVA